VNVSADVKNEIQECRGDLESQIKTWMDDHEKREFSKYDSLKGDILALHTQVAEIARLFEQGKGALTVIKWLAAIVVALWGVIIWAKDHVRL